VVSKAQFFKGKYGTKMEFLEGVGVQAKKPSVGRVWIFSGTTQYAVKGAMSRFACLKNSV